MKYELIKENDRFFIYCDGKEVKPIIINLGEWDVEYETRAIREFDNYVKMNGNYQTRLDRKVIKTAFS